LAREIDDWLPQGINSMIEGSYTPRHLKRYYFSDEMVDQLHMSDRILQHVLLKQLKTTAHYYLLCCHSSKSLYHLALLGFSRSVGLPFPLVGNYKQRVLLK
jgi:hypothetical protein